MAIVLFNKKIKDDIYMLKLKGKFEGKEGQFYMLKPKNTFLAKPISIHDIDDEGITFLYQDVYKRQWYVFSYIFHF